MGYCCQLGEEGNQENEKGCNGKEGGKGHFACVDKRPDVENKGMECVPACKENSHCPEFCGKYGHCCKKGTKANECDGTDGGEGIFACVAKTPLELNPGSECSSHCVEGSHCPQFCGKYGYCCTNNNKTSANSKCNGKEGGNGTHACVTKVPVVINKGIDCSLNCAENAHCPAFCGQHGYCCKKGHEENE